MPTTVIKNETKKLNSKIFELAEDVVEIHEKTEKVVTKLDLDGAQEVLDGLKIINAKYLDIEADLEFLVTKAPVDKDLRRTLAYLTISKELKRIADYTKHIAKYVIQNQEKSRKSSVEAIVEIHKTLMSNLSMLPKLLKSEDFDMAIDVAKRDKKVDSKLVELRQRIVESISKKENLDAIDEKLFALSIVGRMERAGDHMVKICEMIVYIHNGQHVFLD